MLSMPKRLAVTALQWHRHFSVAIIGSGPAGFYCAKELLKHRPTVNIDIFERLPVPYGLLRFGVAPDHPEVKLATKTCAEVAADPRVRWIGNIHVGTTSGIAVDTLRRNYGAVVVTTGAPHDRTLGIPGETLTGIWGARDFVEWYNGMPGKQHYQLGLDKAQQVVIIGMGNVALDCARLLNAPRDLIEPTDCTTYALEAFRASTVRRTIVLGRRSPIHAQFTIKEFRELANLGRHEGQATDPNPWLDIIAPEAECAQAVKKAKSISRPKQRLMELVHDVARRQRVASRSIEFRFCRVPVEFRGRSDGHVAEVLCRVMMEDIDGTFKDTGVMDTIPCDLVLRSIGYHGAEIPGIPYDTRRGVIPIDSGWRALPPTPDGLAPVYATGWAGTGPTGVIATTINNASACARAILSDLPDDLSGKEGYSTIQSLLQNAIGWDDWQRIDAEEKARGQRLGKAAEKIVDVDELLDFALGSK